MRADSLWKEVGERAGLRSLRWRRDLQDLEVLDCAGSFGEGRYGPIGLSDDDGAGSGVSDHPRGFVEAFAVEDEFAAFFTLGDRHVTECGDEIL